MLTLLDMRQQPQTGRDLASCCMITSMNATLNITDRGTANGLICRPTWMCCAQIGIRMALKQVCTLQRTQGCCQVL